MQAFSIEQSIVKGNMQIEDLFEFVQNNALEIEAYEMEQSIFSYVMKIGLTVMQCYFAAKGTGDEGAELILEDGDVLKRERGLRGKDYFSVFGKFKVPRTCYRREGRGGVMPLDARANLPHNCYSYLLQEWMDILSIRNTLEESSISLEKLLGVKVYSNRFEAVTQATCMNYDQYYGQKEAPEKNSEGSINVIGFDGIGVPVIKSEAAKLKARLGKGEKRQKKKEAMVGVSYTIDPKQRTPEEVAGNLVYPENNEKTKKPAVRAENIRRMASLERPRSEVVTEIVSYARERDPESKTPLIVVMDGALALWTLIAGVLKGFEYTGVLDIIHVVEYLWKVANAVFGEKTPEGRKWVYDNLLLIMKGRVKWVIGGLKHMIKEGEKTVSAAQSESITAAITYFNNHHKWMHYDDYLRKGYPIGSGVVESTCGHTVKDRMEGTGRRWSIDGAEAILLLRSVYTSSDWDAYWQCHMELERSFYYHDTLTALGIPDDYDELGCRVAYSQPLEKAS